MRYLTEEEFDRLYLVKRAVARTLLRRAAEVEEPQEAHKLADQAIKILSFLPVKKHCLTKCCSGCNHLSASRHMVPHYRRGWLEDVILGPWACDKCQSTDEFVERYQVCSDQL